MIRTVSHSSEQGFLLVSRFGLGKVDLIPFLHDHFFPYGASLRDHQSRACISAVSFTRGEQGIPGMGTVVLGLQLPALAHAQGGFDDGQDQLKKGREASLTSRLTRLGINKSNTGPNSKSTGPLRVCLSSSHGCSQCSRHCSSAKSDGLLATRLHASGGSRHPIREGRCPTSRRLKKRQARR